jgi:hypothetical protein
MSAGAPAAYRRSGLSGRPKDAEVFKRQLEADEVKGLALDPARG